MGTNHFSYCYDPIGNRRTATNNSAVSEYLANSLNQYSQITNNGALITPQYDLDGNMTAYGEWRFAWDAENRMTGALDEATVANYSYDYMSRRYRKIVNGVTNNFVYDGWNLIRETSSGGVTNTYVWGLDLSGTQQGAGGIGGLFSVMRNGTTYFPCYDANGNITEYVDASGAVVAHREYDAYGNTVASSGQMVNDFSFWFSSKYLDQETGLYYYGYRFYQSETGRWLSRDPLEEEDDPDLYAFVMNHPVNSFDYLGLIQQADDCKKMSRAEFEKWLTDNGDIVDSFVKNMLDHGCIGLTCIDQGRGGYPENEPDTKCWLDEAAAQADCQRCKKLSSKPCCTVFAKQGKWKNNKQPKKRPDGSISCHSVESATPNMNDWNYVLSKNGWYLWGNTAKIPGKTQIFTVCKKFPDYDYPATMWGASCVKTAKMPTP